VVFWTALGLGCAGFQSTKETDSGIRRVRYLELRVLAEKHLNCDKNRLDYKYLGEKTHLLSGCGREVRYLVFSYNGVWVKIESFHERASFDLRCNINKLTTNRLEEGTWLVSGCGRKTTYVLNCENGNSSCGWVAFKH